MKLAVMFPIYLAVNKIENTHTHTHTQRKTGSKSEKERGQAKGPTREVELTHGN